MAKKISRAELAESDLFGDIRSSAEETISVIDKLSAALNETADAVKKSIGGAKFDSSKAIDNFVKSTEKANKLQKQAIELDKARANAVKARKQAMEANQKVLQQQEKTMQQRVRTEEALARQTARKNKEAERATKLAQDESSAYKKLVKDTRDLKNQSKELAAQMIALEKSGKKNSTQWRELSREYRTTTKAAQEGDKQLKKIDSTVGDNFRNVGNYKSALAGLGKSLLALGGGLSILSLAKGAGNIIMDFDQAVGDLAAISGKTKEELKPLNEQAKELGATTQFSATQITEMQIELAKLGFTSDQIANSTAAVANFSAATGADIPAAAALAGASMRAFGLDASEMERVVSTLGVATTKSALDFSYLDTAMSTIAPVAKSFGFSIEDTTALLGTLANSGFDASSAATATRNILLNLADANGDLAQKLGHPIRNADDLAEALLELKNEGVDLAEALELTDKRSVAAFNTFIENAETIPALKEGITGVNDELEAMAEKRLDTISGQFTLLQSAWEGWVLSVNEGSGIGDTVKNTLGFIAQNLDTIMSSLFMAVRAWLQYKATLLAVKGIQWVMSGGFKDLVGNLRGAIQGITGMTGATKTAATGMSTLGKAMNAIPLLAIIGMVVQLAQAFYEVANAAKTARLQQEMLDKAEQQATQTSNKLLQAEKKKFDEKMRLLDLESRKRINAGESEKKVNEERAEAEKKIAEESVNSIKKQRDAESKRMGDLMVFSELYQAYLDDVNNFGGKHSTVLTDLSGTTKKTLGEVSKMSEKYRTEFNKGLKAGDKGYIYQGESSDIMMRIKQEATASIQVVNDLSGAVTEYQAILDERLVAEEEVRKQYKAQVPKAQKVKKELKEIKVEYKDLIELEKELVEIMTERMKLMEDLNKIQRARAVSATEAEIEDEFRKQKTLVENTGQMDTDALDDLVRKKSELKANALRRDAEFEKTLLQKKFYDERRELENKLDEERATLKANALEVYEENQKNFKGDKAKLLEAQKQYNAALIEIDRRHLEELQQLAHTNVEALENMNTELLIIDEELKDDLVDNQKEMNEEINNLNNELITDQETYWATQAKNQKAANDKTKEQESQMWQDRMDMAQVATDFLILLSDRRIKKLDEEIDKAQTQADFLRELAAQGNIDAADSLAEQQRIIDEANRKKMQEEKLKAKIEFANTVFQTYGAKVQAGSESPLTDTIKDVSLLQQFIAQFTPTYKDGTEDTGTHGAGIDGQGGFHAILHPNERVLTKEQNKAIGGLSNDSLAKLAQDYQNGKIMHEGASQMGHGWDSGPIVKRLMSLEQIIKDKPEHDLRVEDVITGAMTIVRETKRGNNVQFNRYRVKK